MSDKDILTINVAPGSLNNYQQCKYAQYTVVGNILKKLEKVFKKKMHLNN